MSNFHLTSHVGKIGEGLALRYIKGLGHTVLAQNYYFEKGKRSGEIDIITAYKGILHFIEVKSRHITKANQKSQALYFPIASQVTPSKMKKCVKTAEHYLRTSKKEGFEYHFDLITVLYHSEEKKAEIAYLSDIFY